MYYIILTAVRKRRHVEILFGPIGPRTEKFTIARKKGPWTHTPKFVHVLTNHYAHLHPGIKVMSKCKQAYF